MGATLSLAKPGSLDPDHILHGLLSRPLDTRQVILRSRRPFVPAAQNLLDNFARLGIRILNGKIKNGLRSSVKMLPGSLFLCPAPVPGLLGWAYPEQLGLSSTACGLVLRDSRQLSMMALFIFHYMPLMMALFTIWHFSSVQ